MRPNHARALIRTEQRPDELAKVIGAWFTWRRFQCNQSYDKIVAEVIRFRPELDRGKVERLLARAEQLEEKQ